LILVLGLPAPPSPLEAGNNDLRDFSNVSILKDLRYLNISKNKIDSLAPLKTTHPETILAANTHPASPEGGRATFTPLNFKEYSQLIDIVVRPDNMLRRINHLN
jgi:Leucine-rich repeat (LRR) protein